MSWSSLSLRNKCIRLQNRSKYCGVIPKQWVSRAMCLRYVIPGKHLVTLRMSWETILLFPCIHLLSNSYTRGTRCKVDILEMGYLVHYIQDSLPFSNSLSSSLRWFSSCPGGFEAWNEMLTILWEMLFAVLWAEQGANIKILYKENGL